MAEAQSSDTESGSEEVTGTEGLEYEYDAETDTYHLVKGVNVESVIIPEQYNGKIVSEIGEKAFAGCEIQGKKLGVIGLGAIGFAFAKMAQGFGMHVLAYSRHKKTGAEYDFIEQVSLDELLARSDFISLHTPHTPATEHMIDQDTIARMKDGVILINTARGALIDEQALADALASGKVLAAGLDVLTDEPPVCGSPLLTAPNTVITGHIAWLTRESRIRAIDMAIDNFRCYLEGHPVSIIN